MVLGRSEHLPRECSMAQGFVRVLYLRVEVTECTE
jgi:hypothetical protein